MPYAVRYKTKRMRKFRTLVYVSTKRQAEAYKEELKRRGCNVRIEKRKRYPKGGERLPAIG